MTVSIVRQMLATFEADGGGALAIIGSINSSTARSPKKGEGGGGAPEEDSTLGRLELAHI